MTKIFFKITSVTVIILMLVFCVASCNKVENIPNEENTVSISDYVDSDSENTTEIKTEPTSEEITELITELKTTEKIEVNKNFVIEKEDFSLVCKNGESYILFNKEYETQPNNDGAYELAPHVLFGSIQEFINTVRNADFSEEQLKEISKFRQIDGKILIFDVNNIYYPTLNGVMAENVTEVYWSEKTYSYECVYNETWNNNME